MRACSREEFWTLVLAKTGTNYKSFADYVRAKCGAIRIAWDRSFPMIMINQIRILMTDAKSISLPYHSRRSRQLRHQ